MAYKKSRIKFDCFRILHPIKIVKRLISPFIEAGRFSFIKEKFYLQKAANSCEMVLFALDLVKIWRYSEKTMLPTFLME